MNFKQVGRRIELLLAMKGKQKRWLAEQLGTSRVYVTQITRGTPCSLARIEEIAKILETTPQYLLFGEFGSGENATECNENLLRLFKKVCSSLSAAVIEEQLSLMLRCYTEGKKSGKSRPAKPRDNGRDASHSSLTLDREG